MKTNQDVLRKHARIYRTYQEATGMRSNRQMWRDANRKEPMLEWLLWTCIFAVVIAWLIVEGI